MKNSTLPNPDGVVTHAGMTRTHQTLAIVGGMFAVLGSYIAYDSITNPNLDGVHPYDRCQYWAYWHNHGGDIKTCQDREMQAIHARIDDNDPTVRAIQEYNERELAKPMLPTKM